MHIITSLLLLLLLQVITVGLGTAENARFFSQSLDYPLEGLYADPTGACYKALGFSPGFAPESNISPYVKLLTMLAGIGSPGTVQEVRELRVDIPGLGDAFRTPMQCKKNSGLG